MSFVRPKFSLQQSSAFSPPPDSLRSLPDLVEFNACYNPKHLFCLQYQHDVQLPPRRITMGDLHSAVLRCSTWLAEQGMVQTPAIVEGRLVKAHPVALLMSSDVGWFIVFLALLRVGVPVVCLSARLSPPAVVHLAVETNARAILISPQLEILAAEATSLLSSKEELAVQPRFLQVPSYVNFVRAAPMEAESQSAPPANQIIDARDKNVVILHSSGTTGLPKPIYHTHAYLLGYAACHRLSEHDVDGGLNFSTLPLYHGFGLLAPCLSLSVGLPVAMFAATTIPTGTSSYEILKSCGATSLMTVPSILEELYLLESSCGVDALRPLRLVAVGGAAMKSSVAEPLAALGVPILNHWGVTELGAIAPIIIPEEGYDWHYLRLRDDLNLRIEAIDGQPGNYRLVGLPLGSSCEFIVQDLLTVNPKKPGTEFKILGRVDDLIVLATGEKVRPTLLEQHVSEHPLVKGAVAIGEGQFQLALLVEAASHVQLDVADEKEVSSYLDKIWPAVVLGNDFTDNHARVTREMILVTTSSSLPLARTPKGSIPRNDNAKLFQTEIDALYAKADMANAKPLPLHDDEQLKEAIREAVHASFTIPRAIADEDDFFERGMDSLQATVLRRRLAASVALASWGDKGSWTISPNFVYANPSVRGIFEALKTHLGSGSVDASCDRIQQIRNVAAEYMQKIAALQPAPCSCDTSKHIVVLLTGSTGSLGSALLSDLARSPFVTKVIGLNRQSASDIHKRQLAALTKIGVDLGEDWKKVVLLEGDLSLEHFGLDSSTYDGLRKVTHIIHNAWPMDFNRSLTSFRPHLDASRNIVQLCLDSTCRSPVRVLFSSSIAVVGRYPILNGGNEPIKEGPLEDPEAIDHFGYAEAKWVCEKMFEEASRRFRDRIIAGNVRIGQLTGPEATGAWSISEHLPMIIKSAAAVGRMPIVEGHASWIPINRASQAFIELLFSPWSCPVYHLENPSRQPWSEALEVYASELKLSSPDQTLPYLQWLDKVRENPDTVANPSVKIMPFLESEFLRMATGQVVLDMSIAKTMSPSLKACGPLEPSHLLRYVKFWRDEGFLR
ncbi:hypothetical protein BKA93DRAFT_731865 [Sparassis latifolia]